MTPTAPLRATVVALLALAASLTGCGNPLEPSSPATSNWAIPTDTAALPATPTTTVPQPTAAPADDPTSNTTRPLATDPAGPTDIPTATAEVSNPTYDINNIDRTDPAQVAWAYLTHRLSHSNTDMPDAGLAAAAQDATPELANQLSRQAAAVNSKSGDSQRIVTVTHLTTYGGGDVATVIATWTLTVDTGGRGLMRTTAGLSATQTLIKDRDVWRVVNDGLAVPN